MKVLNRKWKQNLSNEYELYQMKWEDDLLFIEVLSSYFNPNISLIAKIRQKELVKIVVEDMDVNEVNGKCLYNIPIKSELFQGKVNNVWDFYILNELGEEIRIKSYLNYNRLSLFQLPQNNLTLMPYNTIHNNFSIKITLSSTEVKCKKIELENQNMLINVLVYSHKKIKSIHLGMRETTLYPLNSDIQLIEKINNFFNYEMKSFYCLQTLERGNGILLIFVEFLDGTKEEFSLLAPNVFNKRKSLDKGKSIILHEDECQKIYLQIKDVEIQAQVQSIYSKEGIFEVNGYIYSTKCFYSKHINLVMENRQTAQIFMQNVRIENNYFRACISIEKLIQNRMFNGIWDLYLDISGFKVRLESTQDDIDNKQKVVHIPQQISSNQDNTYAYKLYYTLQNEVSLLIRQYMTIKRINKVIFSKNNVRVEGDFFVEPPLQALPQYFNGDLRISGYYGRSYELECMITTELMSNKYYSRFVLDIPLDQLEKDECEVFKLDLQSNIIQLAIKIEQYPVKLNAVVDGSKVIEDCNWIIQTLKYVRNKKFESLYKIMNKLLPLNDHLVIYQSFHGKSYSDSPKAIYEQLNRMNSKYRGVWVLDNLYTEIPAGTIVVKPFTLLYYYYMARSKYFINNGNFPDFYEKREGTVHVQTWHGTPLKKLGYDISSNSPSYLENNSPELIRRNKRWDYLIAPNAYTSEILKRAFGFEKKMLDVGYPRNDILYNELHTDTITHIKKKIGIDLNKKVILYAPTWRDNDFHNRQGNQVYELKFDLDNFKKRFSEEYILLLRLHYRDASRLNLSLEDSSIINVSLYDDIQELYLISDVLITDYSSVMFDYTNLKRPMIFYCYDYLQYKTKMRGVYLNFASIAPGPIVFDEDQLFEAIEYSDSLMEIYHKEFDAFYNMFCSWEDGKASSRVIKEVFHLE